MTSFKLYEVNPFLREEDVIHKKLAQPFIAE